jgi:hypothetical protein
LTAQKNEQSKSKNTRHNHLSFCHKALKIVLKNLLHLEKNKDFLQVDLPDLEVVYLYVRLAFVVGDIKGKDQMA